MYCTTKQAAEILHRRKENCKLIYCTAQRRRTLLALVEDEGDIHARIRLVTARISVVDDGRRVAINGQRAAAPVVLSEKSVGSLYLEVDDAAAVCP